MTMKLTAKLIALALVLLTTSAFTQKPTVTNPAEVTRVAKAEPTPAPTASSDEKPAAKKEETKSDEKKKEEDTSTGLSLPNTDKLRIRIRGLAGYGFDAAQAPLGYEKQGRVGYAIVEMFGKLNSHLSYRLEVNPVSENTPLISCGEPGYFYPNSIDNVGTAGPKMSCENDGRQRVDDYRFVALDPLMQQGAIRQAYLRYSAGGFGATFGRFVLPIGFGWEELGSFTAKDAPHMQRINAEASFGVGTTYTKRVNGRDFASGSFMVVIGDGNKYRDYDYFYGIDGSLDSNSWPTAVVSGMIAPTSNFEVRAALKKGDTGSKVERLPNFYASKRNDDALVLSARYRPIKNVMVFAEKAIYTWGLMKTSAELLGQADTNPVEKSGYYVGGDFRYPITTSISVGTNITHEELLRDDALIKYLAGQGLYNVSLGKKERSLVYRFYVNFTDIVTVGVYRNQLSNPFPWVSGISPVTGDRAFTSRGSDKWGVIARFTLQ